MRGYVCFVTLVRWVTELHFLCVCTTYYNYRQNLYSIVNNDKFLNMSNDEKLIFPVKFKWKYVCIYLEKAWDKRTEKKNVI